MGGELEGVTHARLDATGELVPARAAHLVRRLALIELPRVLRDGLIAARAHVGEDRGDRVVDAVVEPRRAIEQREGFGRPGAHLPEHARSIACSPATIELTARRHACAAT